MSPPPHLIPRGGDANEEEGIIENISTVGTHENLNGSHPAENQAAQGDDGEGSLSLSSATSATSIASTLSDGVSRPRSASLSIITTAGNHNNGLSSRPNSTPRQRSTPRSRPRSNPRTRTPMRNPSPLLVTGRVDGLLAAEAAAEVVLTPGANSLVSETRVSVGRTRVTSSSPAVIREDITEENHNAAQDSQDSAVRNIFNTSRHRSRAGSIPEEAEIVVAVGSTDSTTAQNIGAVASDANNVNNGSSTRSTGQMNLNETGAASSGGAPRAAGHWLAQAATSSARGTTQQHDRATNPIRSRHAGLSSKQRPSHRKLRRWNNDRFIGTTSESTHILLESEGGGANEQYWKEFYMPNYPCEYRSEFAKLSTDDTKLGMSVRERFVKGERSANNHKNGVSLKGGDGGMWMERAVVSKFHKVGISLPKMVHKSLAEEDAVANNTNTNGVAEELMGKKLFRSINNRIQSVVSRSCALGNSNMGVPSFAAQVATAFESYLVSLALAGSKKEVEQPTIGYPPRQPQYVYDIFDKLFCKPPKVVIRHKKHNKTVPLQSSCANLHAVVIPTVHFYFPAEDTTTKDTKTNGQVKPSSAFYRILLYAVCQFHGLESSSTVIAPRKKKKDGKGGRSNSKHEDAVKSVTVQGGVLLAPNLKLLDYADAE